MSLHSFKLSKPFPPCPAPSNKPLPFPIDEMEFSIWLNTLGSLDDMAKCQNILQVLQTLDISYPPERKAIPGRTRLFFLEKMGAVLIASTTMLTNFPSIQEATSEPDQIDTDMIRSEISVWSTLELANAYSLLSIEDWFKEQHYYSLSEKTSILANGIQAMGRGLLYISQTYTKPYVYFWHKCFQFYRLARLHLLVDPDFNANAHLIDNAFKRVLVFALSNTNQFSPSEMRTIYELFGHYAAYTSLLKSVPKKKFKGIPSIHLKGGGPPTIAAEDAESLDPDQLFIATVAVASKILEATNDRRAHHLPTDRLMLLRLAKTLTLNEQRKAPREDAQGSHLGIMDFGNIVEFLRSKEIEKQNRLAEIGAFDPSRPGELRDLNFEIATPEQKGSTVEPDSTLEKANSKESPLSFQVIEFTDPVDIWKTSQQEHYETNMRLVDKSVKGFGLLWTDTIVKPKVGGIIGVMHKNLTIGLIRWLAQSKETGMFMGVELLGSKATTVKVTNPGYPNNAVSAIYLPSEGGVKQSASLILLNKEFQPSEFIFIHKNHRNVRYRITKQLQLTSYINHVAVIQSH